MKLMSVAKEFAEELLNNEPPDVEVQCQSVVVLD